MSIKADLAPTLFVCQFCKNKAADDPVHEHCPRVIKGARKGQDVVCCCEAAIHHPDSGAAISTPSVPDQAAGEVPVGVETEGVSPPPQDLVVTAPGVFDDMPEAAYHAPWTVPQEYGGSLSHSGAKTLYGKTPAHFQWEREHGRPNRNAFDIGHAVHARVLGIGAQVVRIPFETYNTKEARELRDAAYAEGNIPLKIGEIDEVGDMAEAVLAHPKARVLFDKGATIREQSLFWQDPETGMYLRCRPDSRITLGNGQVVCVDLKSANNADPDDFGRTAASLGYVQQDPFYRAGLQAHGLGDETTGFLFVLVEKEPPFLVSIVELDDEAVQVGVDRNRRAIDLFAQCTQTGEWPGYSPKIQPVSLDYWTIRRHNEEFAA